MATVAALTVAALWVQRYTQSSEALKTGAEAQARAAWEGFEDWYQTAAVAATAAKVANLSTAAQQTAAGLSTSYIAQVTSQLSGRRPPSLPRKTWQQIRNGAPLTLVHSRPAETYKRAIALGASHEEALARAFNRAAGLLRSDITLEDRVAQQKMLDAMGIVHYRRIVRPELSESGSCGWCIAAADRVYNTGDLMPLHPPTCKCIVLPIIGTADPGLDLNEEDLKTLFADGNTAKELRRTRYDVHEHGELGPVITKAGDGFRGPGSVRLEDDPARAARMLAAALPVLSQLEGRDEAGFDVEGALAYQHKLIDRLTPIAAAA